MPKILTAEERAKRWAAMDKSKIKEPKVNTNKSESKTYTVTLLKRSAVYFIFEKTVAEMGIQPGKYLREALIEKLKHDGRLSEDFVEPNYRKQITD